MNQLLNQANAAVLSTLGAPSQTTQTMSSREIAELTGKEHRNVLRDIDKMLTDLGHRSSQFRDEYQDSIGRTLPMYNLPQRETYILVTGYNVAMRARVIDRWMELEQRPVAPSAAMSRLEMAREMVAALEREEAAKLLANQMAAQIAANVLIPRTNVEEHQPSLSLEDFKRLHAPDLSIKVIRQVLQYFGQDRTLRQFGSTPAASTRPFTLDGAAEKIARFRCEATKAISRSGLGIVLTHDCLLGDTARVNKTYAIKYYGYTQSQFEGDSQ